MWNRLSVAGLRQRWASHQRDPGRLAPSHSNRQAPGESGGADSIAAMKRAFLAREVIIECPERDCTGLVITGRREFEATDDARSRVLLRCTRNPQEHEFSFAIEPYDEDEVRRLNTSWDREGRPLCTRCRTALMPTRPAGNGDKTQPPDGPRAYRCVWCGARWVPPAERKEAEGALVGSAGSQQGAGAS